MRGVRRLLRRGASCRPSGDAPRALIVFYRSIFLADDLAPIDALADALPRAASRSTRRLRHQPEGCRRARAAARADLRAKSFDVILNATAFSARARRTAAACSTLPTRRCCRSCWRRRRARPWAASTRGLRAADLAMNVVLPEIDGRIFDARDFVQGARRRATPACEFAPRRHAPDADRIAFVADLAAAWAALRRKPTREQTPRLRSVGLSRARAAASATPSGSIRQRASLAIAEALARRGL